MASKLLKKRKQERKRKNKKNKIILVILSIIVISISIVFLINNLVNYLSTLEEKKIFSSIIVSDRYGFDLNGTALTFGMTRPGGSSSRSLTIENTYDRNVKTEIYIKGAIKKFILASDNKFFLEKGEIKNVSFTASIPSGIEYGNYTGWVTIKIKK